MQRKQRHRAEQSAQAILQQISEVVHNPERERFELWVAGDLVGVLGYSAEVVDGRMTVTILHTVLYDEYMGHGLGSVLTRGALDHISAQGARLRPVCSFTKSYVDKRPGLVELVPA